MQFNRRQSVIVLAASAATLSLPVRAVAQTTSTQQNTLIAWLLEAELPFSPAQIQLLAFDTSDQQIIAKVKLHWPAGWRSRKFTIQKADPDTDLEQLYTQIIRTFSVI